MPNSVRHTYYHRRPKRFLSIILLATFFGMICGPILAAAVISPDEVFTSMHHQDGPPCDHENKEHEPCEDECSWFWCPGHASVLYTVPVAYLAHHFLKPLFCMDLSDSMLLDGIHPRVFRPPRA